MVPILADGSAIRLSHLSNLTYLGVSWTTLRVCESLPPSLCKFEIDGVNDAKSYVALFPRSQKLQDRAACLLPQRLTELSIDSAVFRIQPLTRIVGAFVWLRSRLDAFIRQARFEC